MPVKGYTSITIPRETYNRVKKIAESKNWSATELIKYLVDRYEDPETRALIDESIPGPAEVVWKWPGPYEQIILDPKVKNYYSIAWIRSKGYIDKAGRPQWVVDERIRGEGDFRVEKIFIVSQNAWGENEVWQWIGKWFTYANPFAFGEKVKLFVVKEKECRKKEKDERYYDIGIYGDQLVGFLELDELSNPKAYTWISLPREKIEKALSIFQKIKRSSVPLKTVEDFERLRKEAYDKQGE